MENVEKMTCFFLWFCASVLHFLRLNVYYDISDLTEPLYVHRMTCYLFGRERKVADVPTDHPSCSKQHAVLQYRYATLPPSLLPPLWQRRAVCHLEGPLLRIHIGISSLFSIQTCGEGATRWHDGKESKVITYAY